VAPSRCLIACPRVLADFDGPAQARAMSRRRSRASTTRRITIRLPVALANRLERIAAARGMTKSAVVCEALESYGLAESEPSALDLIRDLVGSVKDAPRDLSYNPKYMRDFGK
jgi:predicted DNA-binding protein